MKTLEELLNTVKLPDMHVLFDKETPDYDSLERAAKAVFGRDDVQVTDAAMYKDYTNVGRVEVNVGDECKVMYIKREGEVLFTAVQIMMNNLLRDDFFYYAVTPAQNETQYILSEEVPGIDVNSLEKGERESIFASEDFGYAYGRWLEGAFLIGLCDRYWGNVVWDGTSLNDLDYGLFFGKLLSYPPYGNYGSGGALYELGQLGHIKFDLIKKDECEQGRQDMRKTIVDNLSKNAAAIQTLCVAYENDDSMKEVFRGHGPREIMLHYASNLEDSTLRKLFKDILAR